MAERYYHDDRGDRQPDRREQGSQQRKLPSWVDYTVISGLAGLFFWQGSQSNRLDVLSKNVENMQKQVEIMLSNDAKADVAVLKEHTHATDQTVSDFRDTILRRFDKLEAKIDQDQQSNGAQQRRREN